jgi:CheY-like chemotaxis protein
MPAEKSLLVVEDSGLLRGGMKMLLEWEGFRVACAANGAQALKHLRGAARPDLILLDLSMPVLTGWQFLEEQRCDPALDAIPVLVVTGCDGEAPPGAAGLLRKPFEPEQLLEAIRRCAGVPTDSR